MAKNKGRRSTGGEANTPNGGVSVKESAPVEDSFPNLDESALANLTSKIEQRLKGGNGTPKKDQKKPKNAAVNEGKKDKKPEQKSSAKQDSAKGKKRDRNGDVISREEKQNGKKNKDEENDALRQEILALGGSKEDFDLIAGVDSDSEIEGQDGGSGKSKGGNNDDALRKELSKMLEGAGHIVPKDIEQDDEEEEVEEVEEDEEDDESGSDQNEEISDVEEDIPEDVSPEPPSKAEKEASKKDAAAKKATKNETEVLPKAYSTLTVPPRSDWYSTPLPPVSASAKNVTPLPRYLVDRIHQHAKSLLEKENKMYAEAQQSLSSSSHKFYSTIMTSGTLSDKISALTLAVQESPLHNTKALENLIGLGKKRSRAQAVEVLRSLKDMFAQGTLLPSDRRLKTFANQPSLVAAFQGGAGSKWTDSGPLPGGLQPIHLIVWAYEDYVKEQYFEVLKILEVWCNDEIEFSRSRAVSYVYELLKEKPEQESNLLRLLVNKLGDPSKKIASRASYLLLQLEQAHPLMKPTIISSIESELLFRPHQSQHARYYAIITLNQTVLSTKEEKVALQLLDIYFSLFVTLLKPTKEQNSKANQRRGKFGKGGKKSEPKNEKVKGQVPEDELREKVISAVLTGVNRAHPFSQSDSERITKHIDTLFRITHSSNFNTSIQALMLIQQITYSSQISADRFYRTLYESLLDPRVATSSKQSLYLNLLFKALKSDLNVKRVKAFVKRLVQILGLHQPSFIVGVFYLIRELEKIFPSLQSLVDQPEENDDDDEEVFRDVPDEDDQEAKDTLPTTDFSSKKQVDAYDPRKRDPEHSNADKSCLWEILPYLSHFHPSVSVNASHLLTHSTMSGKADMTLHTLTHFLDRFIYRTPKANAGAKGSSIMQPLAGGDTSGLLVTVGGVAGKGKQLEPVNSEAFWRKKAEDVAAEDVFFHEYFNRVGKDKARKGKKGAKDPVAGDEEADLDASDNESEVWQAMLDSKPDLDEIDDDNADLDDMSDLEEFDYDEDEDMGEEGVIFNDESDEEEEEEEEEVEQESKPTKGKKAAEKQPSDDEDDEDAFDMDVSDDEAFRDSDEDLPSDMEMGGVDIPVAEPEDAKDKSGRKKRRKLKHLPTFASADDYAALLADEEDGM
ncbi:RNA-binding ribosome biosynthesis protein mak21 [Paecilomyces lecythidis]|uniref:RNA-binding ribosome biosynthesis protein mak21 n=1 Tax=Paecilomyces lecythidis TaxID=3004212 RepID=A0ABR3YBE7_9EURO